MRTISIAALLLAGCVQIPPSAEDIQAKRFEPVPDKAVIYVVRAPIDSFEVSGLAIDDGQQITTQRNSYYRFEVAPGTRRVSGVGPAMESVTLAAAPGRIYFLEHTVIGDPTDGGVQLTALRQVGEQAGRELVSRSQLLR
jgi:hypothetical protein